MTTNPKSPEAIAEELALTLAMKHSGLKCECPTSLWTGDELSESMCSLSEEQHAKLARWMAAILEALRIQREQDAQVCESNFKPEDDCEFECHRADAAAIRGAKP